MKQLAVMSFAEIEEPCTKAPFVLLTGGKGGVGKTTVATNLAIQLRLSGLRVLLVDLDLGLANVNVMLRLSPERTLEDALAGRANFSDCVVRGPAGLHVLPAGSGTAAMGRPDRARRRALLEAITELSHDYDLVLGDSAAGIGHDVLSFATSADRVIVVTTPQPAAMTDAYGLIKALDTWAVEEGGEVPTPELFVNQTGDVIEAERTAERLRSVCERFLARSPRFAGWMPWAAGVADGVARQVPFAVADGKSLEARCLRQLCGRVARLGNGRSGGVSTLKAQDERRR